MNVLLPRAAALFLVAGVCIGAAHPHPPAGRPPAAGPDGVQSKGANVGRLTAAHALQARQERIHILTTELRPSPAPRERLRAIENRSADNSAIDLNDALTTRNASGIVEPSQPGVLAVGPVTDAVAHICGPSVTVCGVWWPTAVTDRAQYQNCMHQSSGSGDLDFGTSPAEYCSALYSGDCDGAAPGTDIYELCSLVPGVAAQWTSGFGYSRFVTQGDCGYYKTVDVREHNVLGFQLREPEHSEDAPAAAPVHPANKPALKMCTGRLYLKILQ